MAQHARLILLLVALGKLLSAPAWAGGPVRGALPRPDRVEWTPGRDPDVLVVKLREGIGLRFDGGVLTGPGDLSSLRELLRGAVPAFHRSPEAIRADRRAFDPEHRLADLTLYLRIHTPDAAGLGTRLLADPRVETAFLALAPVDPPEDIPPETPDFTDEQGYLDAAPAGLGFNAVRDWPGGTGDGVTIADVEYSWDPDHEDLDATIDAGAWGWNSGYYAYHGTAVLGELVAGDNGYGIIGMVPDADILVVSPYDDAENYNVAAAIDAAASMLDAGDVLLIEQQAYAFGAYCPVEVSPDVFDAITLAVAKGIVVVEPSGNGAQDLDDPKWDGWFDRAEHDSGAILVGGGASPDSIYPPRYWYSSGGSSYGSRIDLQGWYDHIVTTTNADYEPDLYYPNNDARQAYTRSFGGTSGASPMITAAAAIAQAAARKLWNEPWDPLDLREALRSTGTPQPSEDAASHPIGPQPDLYRFFMSWGVR